MQPLMSREPSFSQLSGGLVHHGDLLIARVKITSYNEPAAAGSAPFFRAMVVLSATRCTRKKEPTTPPNQPYVTYHLGQLRNYLMLVF